MVNGVILARHRTLALHILPIHQRADECRAQRAGLQSLPHSSSPDLLPRSYLMRQLSSSTVITFIHCLPHFS